LPVRTDPDCQFTEVLSWFAGDPWIALGRYEEDEDEH
jgi:hypothetical protein